MKHIQIFLGHEVGGVSVLSHMENSETPSGLRIQFRLLLFTPDLIADLLVHIFGQLIDQFVNVFLQLLCDRAVQQMLFQCLAPTLIYPYYNFTLTHVASSSFFDAIAEGAACGGKSFACDLTAAFAGRLGF